MLRKIPHFASQFGMPFYEEGETYFTKNLIAEAITITINSL